MLLIPEKTIFIHIPKTGGISIEEFFLKEYGYERNEALLIHSYTYDWSYNKSERTSYPTMHLTLPKVVSIAKKNKLVIDDSWLIFSIVRNPYFKFLSELFFQEYTPLKYHYHTLDSKNQKNLINKCIDEYFDDYSKIAYHGNHSLPQYKFFEDTDINYKIFKFEEGLENIVKKLGFKIKEKFPHFLNIPEIFNLPKPNYSKMLTPYLVETINSKYKKDFEIFGYEMLNPNNIT